MGWRSERVTADDVTVRPWPGGKYDLIQLHRQIRHQNARNLFFTTKLSLPPAIKIKILRKQWKCLCSDVICRLSSLFNILVYGHAVCGHRRISFWEVNIGNSYFISFSFCLIAKRLECFCEILNIQSNKFFQSNVCFQSNHFGKNNNKSN